MIKRTSLNLDLDLVAKAREVLDARTTTDTIHRALEEVVRREALRELAAWDLGGMTLEDLERIRQPRFTTEELEQAVPRLRKAERSRSQIPVPGSLPGA